MSKRVAFLTEQLNFTLDPATRAQLEQVAEQEQRSVGAVVRMFVRDGLGRRAKTTSGKPRVRA